MDPVKQVTAVEASFSAELAPSATVTAAETAIGGEIDCGAYNRITFFLDYAKGDETNVAITPKILRETGGTEYPYMVWTNSSGTYSVEAGSFVMAATGNHYITIDISGISVIKLYQDATGGTPDGTIVVGYLLTED
jgi:hypothetical protein